MAKTWTVQEFERLQPDQQDAVFDASVARDLSEVPPDVLNAARERFQRRLRAGEVADRT